MFLVKGINQNGDSVIEHESSLLLDMLAERLLTDKFKFAHILNQDNVLVGGVRFDFCRMRRISWVRENTEVPA